MQKVFVKYMLAFIAFFVVHKVEAKVLLPQILSSNMVLQRDQPVLIWGFAAVREKVTVSFAGQSKTTITGADGNWQVVLSPLQTSAVPQNMKITGMNEIVLSNILVGEVWVCSGQSNMVYEMRKLVKIPQPKNEKLGFPKNEVEQAKNTNIRIFLVNRKTLSKPDSIHKSWSVAQDSALRAFSAAGYFFAKALQEKLNIPIGVIESAVSGSAIEPWIDKSALAKERFFNGQKIGNDPGKFYTPMIEPLTKFKIRGFLWYQGETNCFLNEKLSYAYKMKTLINSWRKAWNNPHAPFYYVQIAPYHYSTSKSLDSNAQPEFWEAQAQLLRLPKTGMVVTTDLNDNITDLHPTYKWEIGRRLALLALNKDYGQKVEFSAPVLAKYSFLENGAIVTFDKTLSGTKKGEEIAMNGFEIAGENGKYYPASAKLIDDKVFLVCLDVKKPTAVRYNWTENPASNTYTENGLPIMPFRTNNALNTTFKIAK